jgi:hypothetical protein
MNYTNKKRSRAAMREALKEDISFCWFSPVQRIVIKHNSAIVEAIAYRREFSYFRSLIKFN